MLSDSVKSSGRAWYVVQTHAGKETFAYKQLRNQSFDAYLPTVLRSVKRGRKYATIERALFPRYLFVAPDLRPARWRAINATYGVSRLVSSGDVPAPLPRGFVDALKARLAGDACAPDQQFSVGDRVRIFGGPFDRLCGDIQRMHERERIVVLLDLLDRKVPVHVSAAAVVAA